MVRSPAKDEEMLVYAFKKGVLLGPFCEALIRAHPATFAEVRRLAVAHIADAVYCKVFMSTLSGTALDWFVSIPTGHITTFQQFSKMFVKQYIVNKAPPFVSYDLFDIRQYQGESLKDFLNRFGARIVRLLGKDEEMFVHAFKKGVLPGLFSESLIRSHPATFAKIRRRVVAHIAAESEVTEKRGNVAPAKPRAQARV